MKLLHVLVTGLETGIGIWIFSQSFEKREVMEKRHRLSELILYMLLMFGAYSFPAFYYKVDRWDWYLPTLILVSLILLAGYVICRVVQKQLRKSESLVIKGILFAGMVLLISCQYWTCYQSYLFTMLGNMVPFLFLYVFWDCSFIQAYLWEFWYCTNLALLKMIYVTYTGTFLNRNYSDFFLSPRIHTYGENGYLLIICLVILLFMKYVPTKYILKKVLGYKKIWFYIVTVGEWLVLRELVGTEEK